MIKTIYKFEEVIDFAWELSQNDLYASYPRRKSMKEIKENIERAIRSDNRNIVACYREDYEQIAEELIDYASKQLPGYELLIGVPLSNENANQYFKKKNIECIDASFDTRLYNLKIHSTQRHNCIEKITEDNFEEYAIFHDKYAIPLEMYYNSKNLKKNIERFRVFVFRQDGGIHGSIFVNGLLDPKEKEVVGLFVDEEYKNNGIENILINEMLMQLYNEFGTLKEIVYFIDEDCTDELNSALAAGFEIKDNYRCYKCIL